MSGAKPNEVQMYGITVSTDEIFDALSRNDIRMNVFENTGEMVVYQDPNGFFQMFLYRTPKERQKAYEKISRYFRTAANMVTPIYVEKKYLEGR